MIFKLTKILALASVLGVMSMSDALVNPAFAQYYGGNPESPIIVIDKKIRSGNSNTYFDNIGTDQGVFAEGDQIEFKIVVENRGNTILRDIKVEDLLPKYLKLIVFPGNYVAGTNKVELTIESLEPGRSKEITIIARISDLPISNYAGTNQQMTNTVKAVSGNVSDTDSAKYFVEMKSVPSTGAGGIVSNTLLAVTIISSAFGLRKIVRKY